MLELVIIGTGLAGLAAAKEVTQVGIHPTLLEGRERIGGRASTSTINNNKIDVGCSAIHGHQGGNPLTKITHDRQISVHIPPAAPPLVISSRGALTKIEAEALFESSAAQTPKTTAATQDSTSVAQLILPALDSPSLKSLARLAQVGAGVTLEEISAKWNGFGRAWGGADGFPVGGYEGIINQLADEIRIEGATIKLGEEVVKVEDLGPGKGVRVTTKEGETYEAKAVLSTIPLGVLQNVDESFFSPPLSAPLASAIERTTVGTLEKIVLSYESAWWPSPEAHGSYILLPTITDNSTPTSLSGLFSRTAIPVMNFHHSGTSSHSTLLAYIGATAGAFLDSYAAADVAKAMHKYLVSRFAPKEEPAIFTDSEVTSWLSDPFSRGATSAPTTLARSADGVQASPLDLVLLGRSEWDGRLGFAGEHTELDTRGSAGGAFASGEREGRRLVELLSRI